MTKIKYTTRSSVLKNADGEILFVHKELIAPENWSQNAVDMVAQKYLRKNGIPYETILSIEDQEAGVPDFLCSRVPVEGTSFDGCEYDFRDVFDRLSGCWAYWGWKYGYFGSRSRVARKFKERIFALLEEQVFAPNSPQWFNTGLNWKYGIKGESQGHFHDDGNGSVVQSNDCYTRPQAHACYIQKIEDDLIGDDGIFSLARKEARLFKLGSGTGTNFSNIRAEGEPLSGGGVSSGLMSFLKVLDAGAGAIKSGGTTRRAAKMVCLDIDHPDVEDFISWKSREENKVASLVTGSKVCSKFVKKYLDLLKESKNEEAQRLAVDALEFGIPAKLIERAYLLSQQGVYEMDFKELDTDWQGEAYRTISGQNANNSIRITDEFMDLLRNEPDAPWHFRSRTEKDSMGKTTVGELWDKIVKAAWISADPGLQFHDITNSFNPTNETINASNPCSEYLFLDDTACNLLSINLLKFLLSDGTFDVERFEQVCSIAIQILDITVSMAQYPYESMAKKSLDYRTLGLGFANLGALIMSMGLEYGGFEACVLTGLISSTMQAVAHNTSSVLAEFLGTYPAFDSKKHGEVFSKFHENHLILMDNLSDFSEELSKKYEYLSKFASRKWNAASENFEKFGQRNAQLTCIAPTGTIALVMDCDTTGAEPGYGLVTYKSLAGGGSLKLVINSVKRGLTTLGYSTSEIEEILKHVEDKGTVIGANHLDPNHYSVFNTAVSVEEDAALTPEDHLNQVEAIQSFVSGGVSKTINMPSIATLEDVSAVLMSAWVKRIKNISIYRDGAKLSQPLSLDSPINAVTSTTTKPKATHPPRCGRQRLPNKCNGYRQKFVIGQHNLYLHTGEYENGEVGEIFVDGLKQGHMMDGLFNCFAIAVSLGLQHGVPLDEFVKAFTFTQFEPRGLVEGHDQIKMCTSPVDALFRDLAANYLNRQDLVHAPVLEQKKIEFEKTKDVVKFEGSQCSNCYEVKMIRNGTCLLCTNCGETTGCS